MLNTPYSPSSITTPTHKILSKRTPLDIPNRLRMSLVHHHRLVRIRTPQPYRLIPTPTQQIRRTLFGTRTPGNIIHRRRMTNHPRRRALRGRSIDFLGRGGGAGVSV